MPEARKIDTKTVTEFLLNNIIPILLVVISVAVGIIRPSFFINFKQVLINLINNTAPRFILALGVSGCLIARGTDLSAGRSAGLAGCIAATFLQRSDYGSKVYPNMGDLSILVVLFGVMLIAAMFGAINGSVISFLKVPPFIATLGMQTIIYGICLIFSGAQPIGGLRDDYTAISSGFFLDIRVLPYLLFIAAFCGGIMWFVYNKTSHGKYMYAIGGNEAAAEGNGINTSRTKIIIYTSAGALYGLAGFLWGAKAGGASVGLAAGYELEAIAGCTIGGVSTNGGVGRISGILVGVLVFELLKIAMNFIGVDSNYTYIVQGIVIILAVAVDMRKYVGRK